MNIFVGGSLRDVPLYGELCKRFVQHLGERIVERGHTLFGGCRGSLDKAVAEAASSRLAGTDRDKPQQLISYRIARFGRFRRCKAFRIRRGSRSHAEARPFATGAGSDPCRTPAGR